MTENNTVINGFGEWTQEEDLPTYEPLDAHLEGGKI